MKWPSPVQARSEFITGQSGHGKGLDVLCSRANAIEGDFPLDAFPFNGQHLLKEYLGAVQHLGILPHRNGSGSWEESQNGLVGFKIIQLRLPAISRNASL